MNRFFALVVLATAWHLACAQVSPQILVSKKDVCTNGLVALEVVNCPSCTTFDWEVGKGSGFKNGTSKYSYIALSGQGWFDVTVKIHDASGNITPIEKKKAFFVHQNPIPGFTVNKTTFCNGGGELVIIDTTANSVSRDWLVDGTISYNGPKTVKYTFGASPGYKRLYIQITDSWGCKGTFLRDSLVSVWDSVKVDFAPSTTIGCAPKTIYFTPKLDTAVQSIATLRWEFPGANTATSLARVPKGIYYPKGDTFDVGLTLTTKQGCTYKYLANNLIQLADTGILGIHISKNSFCINEEMRLYVTGNKLVPNWEIKGILSKADTLAADTIKVRFKDTGKAELRVYTLSRGCLSETKYSGISVQGPRASFQSEYPFFCMWPKKLLFTNKSLGDPNGTTWGWSVLEQNTSLVYSDTGRDLSYTANSPKSYGIRLIAYGGSGCNDTAWKPFASIYGKIDTNFTVVPKHICPGGNVTLIPTVGPGTKLSRNYVKWTFYYEKGNIEKIDTLMRGSCVYNKIGNYTAKLVVWNNANCKDSLKLKDTIHVISPNANIRIDDTLACVNQLLTAYAWGKSGGNPLKQWQIHNIDSLCDDVYAQRDTFDFYLRKTGRWRVKFTLRDTVGGCTQEIVYPYLIKVSGVAYAISADPEHGCAPLSTNLKSKPNFNVNYENSNSNITVLWRSVPPAKVFFTDSTNQNTSAVVSKGVQAVRLVYENAVGCKDSTGNLLLYSGISVGFEIPSSAFCRGISAKIRNTGSNWIQKWQYTCDSPSVEISSLTVPEPYIKFTKEGIFRIKLVGAYDNCMDSFETIVRVYDMKAKFYASDTVSFCAPKLINLINKSTSPVSNQWFLGDGDSAVSYGNDILGHLYQKNSRKGFDVKLISKNGYGCVDTLLKKNYIKIIGPEPDFAMTNTKGCEPLRVHFINKSSDYTHVYLDYGNGVVLDSPTLQDHAYRVTDKSQAIQKFIPRLLLQDSIGCSALALSRDTIQVFKNAEAHYSITSQDFLRKQEGCAGRLLVSFINTSKFCHGTYWDFDNDAKPDAKDLNNPSWFYADPGVFYPMLVAVGINGCKDTIKNDSIVAWEGPKTDFSVSADSSCAIYPIQFYAKTKSKYPIIQRKWDFGELPLFADTSTQQNPKWKFITPFDHLVVFTASDIHLCKDQAIRDVYIYDTAGPARPELAYITVRDNKFVDCSWQASRSGNFWEYRAYLDSINLWEKYRTNKRYDTALSWYYDSLVVKQRFCFTVSVEDSCHQLGGFGRSHCTMVLRDTLFEPFNVQLNWLSYDGWGPEISHYEVFRKDSGANSFVRIASVKSNRQTYTDSFLCNKVYQYYVEAVNKNGIYRSRSNVLSVRPIYIKPKYKVNTSLVSVENNAYTKVNWENYPQYYRKYSYILEKSYNGLPGSFFHLNEFEETTTNDMKADIASRVNFYRVIFKDHCGVKSMPGVVSNSIWLKAIRRGINNVTMLWNPYGFWYSGVKEYGLQLRDSLGKFNNFKTVGPNIFEVDSIKMGLLNLDSVFFRVYAVKDTVTADTAFSNIVCLVPASYTWTPNSFTPDQNDRNDIFKPVVGFIHKHSDNPDERYELKIYDRWGQEVFFSDDADIGWDGTCNKKPCPEGMYIYTIKALGYDGVSHVIKGTVMLLR